MSTYKQDNMNDRLYSFNERLDIIASNYVIDKYNLIGLLLDYNKLDVLNWIDYDLLLNRSLNLRSQASADNKEQLS